MNGDISLADITLARTPATCDMPRQSALGAFHRRLTCRRFNNILQPAQQVWMAGDVSHPEALKLAGGPDNARYLVAQLLCDCCILSVISHIHSHLPILLTLVMRLIINCIYNKSSCVTERYTEQLLTETKYDKSDH